MTVKSDKPVIVTVMEKVCAKFMPFNKVKSDEPRLARIMRHNDTLYMVFPNGRWTVGNVRITHYVTHVSLSVYDGRRMADRRWATARELANELVPLVALNVLAQSDADTFQQWLNETHTAHYRERDIAALRASAEDLNCAVVDLNFSTINGVLNEDPAKNARVEDTIPGRTTTADVMAEEMKVSK